MKPVEVVVTSDFICPWCWIGHRNLKDGIAQAGLAAGAVRVRFAPFELNPNTRVRHQSEVSC
jgi:predicted DsbA family dithiol-disulfide isomerase